MSFDSDLTLIFKILHAIFGGVGLLLNLLLLLLAIFKSPKAIQAYSTLIINFAVTDALSCFLDIFIEIRVLPYPDEDSMGHMMSGACKYFGLTTCAIGFSFYLHTLTHSVWSLLISFGYRYLILFNSSFKVKNIMIVIFAFYLPSLLQAVTYWANFVPRNEILPIIQKVHPDYILTEEIGLLTGLTDLYNPSVIYGMLHTTLPITPVYILVFILRWKITRTLLKDQNSMSKETKLMHSQLLRVITLQAILPSTSFVTVYIFIGLRLGLLSGQVYEHLVFSIAIFMPSISPILYFIFIKPYRLYLSRILCCKTDVQDRTQTRMYSPQDQSTSANRK